MSEKKIEQFWRDATAEDVAKVMRGEKVEARFRDEDRDAWFLTDLGGWTASGGDCWVTINDDFWKFCQVYDPPQWYLDKPDPGEGYRLLEKFPMEDLKPGDEAWGFFEEGKWTKSVSAENGHSQDECLWYRRRIETIPEKPDGCKSEKLRICNVGDVVGLPSGKMLKVTQTGFEVL